MSLQMLRELRLKKGLSQSGLAAILGTTQATISRTENGIHKPRGAAKATFDRWLSSVGEVDAEAAQPPEVNSSPEHP
ncbi:DNA-binding transcriptional regulator [Roseibium sp. RKSG952]|uniref:helix-turn-helix domain-containing protein n=1 Tax=Roseibium sp. RKSG952 TaxID=2529384 RepID=UPI0012BC9259|nr:helix-turn-helix transcriptional regulator [Roseibium sp. RKSG952]MTH95411.1 XRE family transcriptional regulator [Roseibium sp. RKSG952]